MSFDEFEAEGADMAGDAIAEDGIAYLKTINSGALGPGGLGARLAAPASEGSDTPRGAKARWRVPEA
ncbi:MAG: hypothetical protein ABL864_14675 [Terricaulis sp.]